MNKHFQLLAAVIGWAGIHIAISYVIMAFILLELNITVWSQSDRWFAICIAVGSAAITKLIAASKRSFE